MKLPKSDSFSAFHPAALFFYFAGLILITIFTVNPLMLGIALIGALCYCIFIEKGSSVKSDLSFYIPMFILVSVTNPLFSHNGITPLFFMNGNPVTLEAVFYGINIALLLAAVAFWCRAYSETVTEDKFLFLFSKTLPKTALVLSMAIRFIPVMKRQAKKISSAQKAMGLYSSKSYIDKLRGAVRVLSALITWSLENAVDTARSMRARGYGLKGRKSFSLFKFTARDAVIMLVSAAMFAFVLFGLRSGAVHFAFYPSMSRLPLTPMATAVYICYGAAAFLPFTVEIKESLKWKYYVSKI
ncbi:MAG: energy-coupling factor transporter transmembrane protein EcfT [Clostridia bacterium]|nr:energy-coupling factor transporter transmembrane protein EcfT [Clostridia bacterium]